MRIDRLPDFYLPAMRRRNGEIIIWVLNFKITIFAFKGRW